MTDKAVSLNHKDCFVFTITYIECLMAVVFGSDEWGLNDVQVSSCHCHWGISAVCEREKIDKALKGYFRLFSQRII